MKFEINDAISLLERTPRVLQEMLGGLTLNWTHNNEGEGSWSPFDVLGHLIHGEKTDWIPRTELILANPSKVRFTPFDRFAQFENSKGKQLKALLSEFEHLRSENIKLLKLKKLSEVDLTRIAEHPELGQVRLQEMLAAWVVHDLGHIAQISRVIAKQYKNEVGPWTKYLTILNSTPKE